MLALARMPVICMLGFYAYLQVSIATYVTSPQRISGDGNLFSPTANITLTVYGVTLKTGSDRLTDSLGRVNFHGGIDGSFPLAVTVGAEGNQPGISGFDYVRRVLYYTGSSSFGGAVLSANVSNSPVVLPPTSYLLKYVTNLGYDPVTGSRVIVGQSVFSSHNLLILDHPISGSTSHKLPDRLELPASSVYDPFFPHENASTWRVLVQDSQSKWSLESYNVLTKVNDSLPLTCIPADAGPVNVPLFLASPGTLRALVLSPSSGLTSVSIDLNHRACRIEGSLGGLPESTFVVPTAQIGYQSGNLVVHAVSQTSSVLVVYDRSLNILAHVDVPEFKTVYVQEDK